MEDINETCQICHGEKYINAKTYHVIQVCPKCNGLGHIDWVSYAMGQNTKDHNRQLMHDAVQQNIHNMLYALREQYYMVGMEIDIKVKPTHQRPEANLDLARRF